MVAEPEALVERLLDKLGLGVIGVERQTVGPVGPLPAEVEVAQVVAEPADEPDVEGGDDVKGSTQTVGALNNTW